MNTDSLDLEVNQFINSLDSLSLATLNYSGHPSASYTPFCRLENSFGIYISSLAAHTQELSNNHHLSVMWIADEANSPNPFARQRLVAQATATLHPRKSKGFEEIEAQMTSRFPQMMAVLSELGDFQAFELQLTSCRYIKGFGKAYLSENGDFQSLTHLSPNQ